MKLLKDTIEEALLQAGCIEDGEARDVYERELWLHITGLLRLCGRGCQEGGDGAAKDSINMMFLNPACPFYADFREVLLAMHAAEEVDFEEVGVS